MTRTANMMKEDKQPASFSLPPFAGSGAQGPKLGSPKFTMQPAVCCRPLLARYRHGSSPSCRSPRWRCVCRASGPGTGWGPRAAARPPRRGPRPGSRPAAASNTPSPWGAVRDGATGFTGGTGGTGFTGFTGATGVTLAEE